MSLNTIREMKDGPGARFLLLSALAVVTAYGLRALAPILLPFALALFLAIITLPLMLWLQRKGVRAVLAILVSVLVVVAVFGAVGLLGAQSVTQFQDAFPRYRIELQILFDNSIAWLQQLGVPYADTLPSTDLIPVLVSFLNIGQVLGLAGSALTFVGTTFLVLIIMVFILGEATIFPAKFRYILGAEATRLDRFAKITQEIQEYLLIKTLVSLATGLLLGLWCWALGVDFPVLLGLTAFVLNYVPTIGSVIAAVPAATLALVDPELGGLGFALVTSLGYVAVNLVFGNLIEPNLMGRRLGISTLVVILSLLFWNWAWGPLGALLSVPLTMMVKIMLENTEDLRWVAVLIDKNVPVSASEASSEAGGVGAAVGSDMTGGASAEARADGMAAPESTGETASG